MSNLLIIIGVQYLISSLRLKQALVSIFTQKMILLVSQESLIVVQLILIVKDLFNLLKFILLINLFKFILFVIEHHDKPCHRYSPIITEK